MGKNTRFKCGTLLGVRSRVTAGPVCIAATDIGIEPRSIVNALRNHNSARNGTHWGETLLIRLSKAALG